jgi:hypothetical protein
MRKKRGSISKGIELVAIAAAPVNLQMQGAADGLFD